MADKKTMEMDDNELEKAAGGVGFAVDVKGEKVNLVIMGTGNEQTPLTTKETISSSKQAISVNGGAAGTAQAGVNGKTGVIYAEGVESKTDAI